MSKRRAVPLFLLLALGACGGATELKADEVEDPEGLELESNAELAQTLEGCGLRSCPDWRLFGGPTEPGQFDCVGSAILAGEPTRLEIFYGADGGFACGRTEILFIGADGGGYIAEGNDSECDDVASFQESETYRCKGVPREDIEACMHDGSDCIRASAILRHCLTVDAVRCP